jgi:hypothetical protein
LSGNEAVHVVERAQHEAGAVEALAGVLCVRLAEVRQALRKRNLGPSDDTLLHLIDQQALRMRWALDAAAGAAEALLDALKGESVGA